MTVAAYVRVSTTDQNLDRQLEGVTKYAERELGVDRDDLEYYRDKSTGTDIEPRTRRALERVYTVTHTDGTPIGDGETPTVVSVHSGNSGKERRVDVREGRCTCPDHEHRGVECAHIRRARITLGRQPVDTATLAAVDVHKHFAEHAPGPAVVTSDGGVIEGDSVDDTTDDTAGETVRVPVSGGILVFEREGHGKSLVGFESVTDWDQVADALAARGHDRGAVYHLPEFDGEAHDCHAGPPLPAQDRAGGCGVAVDSAGAVETHSVSSSDHSPLAFTLIPRPDRRGEW